MERKHSCVRLVEQIVKEIDNLPSGPFWIRDVVLEKRYSFPIVLNGSDGKEICITPEINVLLASFSRTLMDEFFVPQKSEFTNSEWNHMVKGAFGDALVNRDENKRAEEAAAAILTVVQNTIHDRIRDIQEHEYVFGCHFCNIPDFEPLSIGPVCFEPRHAWLARVHGNSCISNLSQSRIQRAWKGRHLRKRKPSEDKFRESNILDAIGNGNFVCGVAVGRMGAEAGLQKAVIAARLATTAIALAWARPASTLEAMTLTFDPQPHRRVNLVLSQDGSFGRRSSWTYLSGGVTWLSADDWRRLRADFSTIFDCAGEAVRYVTHGHIAAARPNIMKVLHQALLWFHEGCREDVDPMAIVKFCSSMEALTGGRKNRGILELMKAHLRIQNEDKLRKDLEGLYRAGRSRTVHGTNDRLGHDWSDSRILAEQLARMCLISCLQWAAEHRQSDDPRCFSQSKT